MNGKEGEDYSVELGKIRDKKAEAKRLNKGEKEQGKEKEGETPNNRPE